jgi:hypothetical protein
MIRKTQKPNTHKAGIDLLEAVVTRRRFHTIREHHHCDLVAHRLSGGRVWTVCGENDQFPATVLPNARRDFRDGCNAMVILAPDARRRATYRRMLKRHLPRSIWTRIGIVTCVTCAALIAREQDGRHHHEPAKTRLHTSP